MAKAHKYPKFANYLVDDDDEAFGYDRVGNRPIFLIGEPETGGARVDVDESHRVVGHYRLAVYDEMIHDMLSMQERLLQELKTINLHLSTITDETFDPQDTE